MIMGDNYVCYYCNKEIEPDIEKSWPSIYDKHYHQKCINEFIKEFGRNLNKVCTN